MSKLRMLKMAICETVSGTALRLTLMAVVLSKTQLTLVIPESPEQVGDAEMVMEEGRVRVK